MDPILLADNEAPVSLISSALTHITTIFNAATDMITGNAIAMVFIGFSLVGAGVAFFGRIAHRH